MAQKTEKNGSSRKNDILDAAQDLFVRQGYEETPVSAILDAAGVAKGTFYHYFTSKEDLLDTIVERVSDRIMEATRQAMSAEQGDALRRLNAFFEASAQWKTANRELIQGLIKPVCASANIVLRHKMRQRAEQVAIPLLGGIIRQGVEEGVFDTPFPDEAAELIVGLSSALQEGNAGLLLDAEEHPENWDRVWRRFDSMADGIERLLGAPAGSVRLTGDVSAEEFRSIPKEPTSD